MYRYPWEEPIYAVSGGIALVDVRGALFKGLTAEDCYWHRVMSTDRLQSALAEISAREDVAIVVFNFNSPGGMSTGIPEAAAQIAELNQRKLCIAFTDTQCCSAAYWLASQCGLVLSTLSAGVGSIGTYLALYDYLKMLEEEGITLHLFKRGELKAAGLMGKEVTEADKAFFDAMVGRVNDRFLAAVRSGRSGRTIADSTMQGQWFDGEEAVSLGLADRVVSGLPEVLGNAQALISSAFARVPASL